MDNFINKIKKVRPSEIKGFVIKYEKPLSFSAMVLGFVIDVLTLTRVDLWLDNLILLSYLALSGIIIILLNSFYVGKLRHWIWQKLIPWAPIGLQFAFGGLFSGFVVLYSRSASLSASWLFLAIMAFLLIANEFFEKRYHKPTFQLSIYFIAIFSYLIFAVPVLINKVGALTFLLSGFTSLFIITIILRLIAIFSGQKFFPNLRKNSGVLDINSLNSTSWRSAWVSVFSIYVAFNIFYFTSIIPPIPLSLKDKVVAHSIQRTSEGYRVVYEPAPWYMFFKGFNNEFNYTEGNPVYIFNSIFAPADIETEVIHEWQNYNKETGKWETAGKIQYHISGGRDKGYRGFSLKTGVWPGKWRVNVKTKNGLLLGRIKFKIVEAKGPFDLISEIR